MTALTLRQAPALPALLAAADDRARMRYIEFFTATIRNPNTRRAYASDWHRYIIGTRIYGTAWRHA